MPIYLPMSGVNTKQKTVYASMSGVNTKMKTGHALLNGVNTKVFSSGTIATGEYAYQWSQDSVRYYGTPTVTLDASGLHVTMPWTKSGSGSGSGQDYADFMLLVKISLPALLDFVAGLTGIKINSAFSWGITSASGASISLFPPELSFGYSTITYPVTAAASSPTFSFSAGQSNIIGSDSSYDAVDLLIEVGFLINHTSSRSSTLALDIPNSAISILADASASTELPINFG